jgi:hypothetical protein
VVFFDVDLVEVDDPVRPPTRLRQLGVAELELFLPLMHIDLIRPEHPDPSALQAWEKGELGRCAHAENQIVDPVRPRDDGMRLLAGAVDEAVAGADLVRRLDLAVVLPREPRAGEDKEDLLLAALHVQRRRAGARLDLDAVDADRDASGRRAEIGP